MVTTDFDSMHTYPATHEVGPLQPSPPPSYISFGLFGGVKCIPYTGHKQSAEP